MSVMFIPKRQMSVLVRKAIILMELGTDNERPCGYGARAGIHKLEVFVVSWKCLSFVKLQGAIMEFPGPTTGQEDPPPSREWQLAK